MSSSARAPHSLQASIRPGGERAVRAASARDPWEKSHTSPSPWSDTRTCLQAPTLPWSTTRTRVTQAQVHLRSAGSVGARWEVALPLTMVSAARWENWVRAATRAEASMGKERKETQRLPPQRESQLVP